MQRAISKILAAPLSAKFGMIMVVIFMLCAIFAPQLAPYGETEVVAAFWQPPSLERVDGNFPLLLGTDQIGRDVLSRMLYGARNTIFLALVITALGFLIGVSLGLLASTLKGFFDQVISRTVDILMAFPTLILALVVLTVMGTSTTILVLVIALIDSTRVFRVSRAVAADIEVMDFVEVARLRGERLWWVMSQEILPNALPPLIAEFGLRFCFVFLFISSLSFLGLGLQPPTADWGSMVRENAAAISFGIITPLLPAAAVGVLTISVNFIVDWFLHEASGIKD
jgi:peptide/nickel transport system permease protein